jgi:hypothetical protein
VCSIAGNVIVTMLASSWPMNAPKQTTLTASHGARRLSRMTAGLACSCRILLLTNILTSGYQVLLLTNIFATEIPGSRDLNSGHAERGAGLGVLDPTDSWRWEWSPVIGSAAPLEYAGKRLGSKALVAA